MNTLHNTCTSVHCVYMDTRIQTVKHPQSLRQHSNRSMRLNIRLGYTLFAACALFCTHREHVCRPAIPAQHLSCQGNCLPSKQPADCDAADRESSLRGLERCISCHTNPTRGTDGSTSPMQCPKPLSSRVFWEQACKMVAAR